MIITLIASNFRQAELAARQLGLTRRQWRLANRIEDLRGITAEGIILVKPVIGFGPDLLRHWDARDYARVLADRDRVTLRQVST